MLSSKRSLYRAVGFALLAAVIASAPRTAALESNSVQFVFTSDAHYGLTRGSFRGATNVIASVVNKALVAAINALPEETVTADGGLRAGQRVGAIDFVVEGGDIANRQELLDTGSVQSATVSWAQFRSDYIDSLRVTTQRGERAPLYVLPGNHDVSNAIGYYKPLLPPTDPTAMVEIYNRMLLPRVPRTLATFDFTRDKVLYSHDVGGIHFLFLPVWPDSTVRAWIDRDLQHVPDATPVVIFAHDKPSVESKHTRNPNGAHDVNEQDRFENVLADEFADGTDVTTPTYIEQRELEAFLARHRNITAYFHGHANWNEFYEWTGPRHSVALHTFRVDSPMKGDASSKDETRLSFQVATIDTSSLRMTVRECLWNVDPHHKSARMAWGESTTIDLGAAQNVSSEPSGAKAKQPR